ncbi:MAG: hypothetical protein PVJ84_01750 [Desulfobacteraceae bacterium]|jgi:hypothetical protein
MTQQIDAHSWVYVLVQNPGSDDHIVGQMDSENEISFIPMFLNKEAAFQSVIHMVKEKGQKYEIQAIIYEDLEKYASKGRFILFVIDAEGKVIDKRVPFQTTQ